MLYSYQAFFAPKPPAPAGNSTSSTADQGAPAAAPAQQAPVQAPAVSATPPSGVTAVLARAILRSVDVRVETAKVIDRVYQSRRTVKKLAVEGLSRPDRGEPLELVANDLSFGQPLPRSLAFYDATDSSRHWQVLLRRALRRPRAVHPRRQTDTVLTFAGGPSLTFEYRDSTTVYRPTDSSSIPRPYHREAFLAPPCGSVTRSTGGSCGAPVLATAIPKPSPLCRETRRACSFRRTAESNVLPRRFAAQPSHEGVFGYAGVDDHYFMTVALEPGPSKVIVPAVAIPSPAGRGCAARADGLLDRPSPADQPFTFYAGPKDFDVLAAVDRDLVRAINFGMFAFIVVPLLAFAELDQRLRRQLRLVDRHPHDPHQRC